MRTDELGRGYDLALLSAICHMFGPEENRELFGRCYRALAPGGRLLMRDFILDPDGTSPRAGGAVRAEHAGRHAARLDLHRG